MATAARQLPPRCRNPAAPQVGDLNASRPAMSRSTTRLRPLVSSRTEAMAWLSELVRADTLHARHGVGCRGGRADHGPATTRGRLSGAGAGRGADRAVDVLPGGGGWFPTHVGPTDRVADWGRQTYDVLAEQAARGVPGVVMRESLALYREPPGEPEWADAVRGVRDATAAELPPGYEYGLRYVVPLVEMPLYLPWLAQQIGTNGAEVYTRRVRSLPGTGRGRCGRDRQLLWVGRP